MATRYQDQEPCGDEGLEGHLIHVVQMKAAVIVWSMGQELKSKLRRQVRGMNIEVWDLKMPSTCRAVAVSLCKDGFNSCQAPAGHARACRGDPLR